MSIPTSDTIWGYITIDGVQYGLLNQPLESEQFELIKKYKKDNNCGFSSASWNTNKYIWILKNKELYLKEVYFKYCNDSSNLIEKVFHTDLLKSDLLNKDLKVFISNIEYKNEKNKREKKRKIKILTFKNGFLVDSKDTEEIYTSSKLKEYLDS